MEVEKAKRLFGTNGVRGIVNRELTPKLVLELSQAIGTFFGRSKILLGRDGRASSRMFSEIAASGLVAAGCDVYDAGMAPTPAIQYLTRKGGFDGAIIITASHNPPEYNGLKVIDRDGIEISSDKELEIEGIYFSGEHRLAEWRGLGERFPLGEWLEDYRESVKSKVDQTAIRNRKPRIVVDSANGVGSLVTPYLARELGCQVLTLNSNIDGTFPGRLPEPTPENLGYLCEIVRASRADIGVAHDGDADRAIFVDETGQVHWGDRSFALITEHFLKGNPGHEIVTPVSSSQIIEDVASKYEGKVYWTPVGSPYVSRAMATRDSKLGGEENGGIFYGPHMPVRDGAMATALMLEIIAQSGERLSTLMESLPRYFNVKDKIPCPKDLRFKVLDLLMGEVESFRVETIDGLKVWHDDKSWILIRPSGTEPIYRLFAEAKSQEKAQELVSRYKAILGRLIGDSGE
ncbi:phosphoglucosamine mutase [Candidatus Bathyarchaeota archaeon]|nr:phosphoglucosamine mutase [Candidatus Bathyarchaeota archaeon]